MDDFNSFDFSRESFSLDDLMVFCNSTGFTPSEILLFSIDKKLERIGMLQNSICNDVDTMVRV